MHGKTGPASVPLTIGSSKANIGHANTAAGAIGFIKMCMQIQHETITPICHFSGRNPLIEDVPGSRALEFPTKAAVWEARSGGRVGAVSSFGIGGTNVHVILEQQPIPPAPVENGYKDAREETLDAAAPGPPPPSAVLVLSAGSKSGLEELRAAFLQGLASGDLTLAGTAYTLLFARPTLPYRLGFCTAEQLAQNRVRKAGPDNTLVFLFAGQGSQHPGMGRVFLEQVRPQGKAGGFLDLKTVPSSLKHCLSLRCCRARPDGRCSTTPLGRSRRSSEHRALAARSETAERETPAARQRPTTARQPTPMYRQPTPICRQ